LADKALLAITQLTHSLPCCLHPWTAPAWARSAAPVPTCKHQGLLLRVIGPAPHQGPGVLGLTAGCEDPRPLRCCLQCSIEHAAHCGIKWRSLERCWWPDMPAPPDKGREYPGLGYKQVQHCLAKAQLQRPAAACNHHVFALCAYLQLEEDMAEVSMERHGHAKQLVVFFGAAGIGTGGGWGADAVLRACRKVVCRTRGTDQRRGRVVLVDEHRTSRVSSAVNGQQPCERQLNKRRATRPAGWKPPAGQVEPRLVRPAWSQQRDQPVRGMMWCPIVPPRKPPQAPRSSQAATQPAAASDPGPSTPLPAKRTKRTKAEPEAAEPTKGKGKAAKAKPAPQPGRWLDRDCNAALNMQRIGESRWRPLELCYWPDQGALPAKGKEYPGLGYKRLRDKPPKAQQQQPAGAHIEHAAHCGIKWRSLERCWWPDMPAPPDKGREYPGLGYKQVQHCLAKAQLQRPAAASGIGTGGGWGADAVLRACRKVVCRTRGTDQRRGRVVLVDEHRTSRVSSAVNGQQPCERQLNKRRATRPAGWKPPAGQVEPRLVRPAWSQQRDQPVRGMMWCPIVPPRKPPQAPRSSQAATQPAAASDPGPSTPLPAKRTKRTKAEPEAAEPTKGKGKAAKAKPAPQPGRWLDRDCNAALNMQRIGESRWRPLELCYWPDQGALPAKGKEYPGLGYKRLRDKPPKAQQQQPAGAQ
ncbi:hypothetical protein QJQ45_022937, partial [Haematococcus lacustris]